MALHPGIMAGIVISVILALFLASICAYYFWLRCYRVDSVTHCKDCWGVCRDDCVKCLNPCWIRMQSSHEVPSNRLA